MIIVSMNKYQEKKKIPKELPIFYLKKVTLG